ncbi:MAG: cysteine desulfurase, partial [Gemmobacter sp.]
VTAHCSMCHAAEPLWPGLAVAPKGVVLETDADVARHARAIYLQAAVSHAMPPGGLIVMDQADRDALAAWVRAAR